MKIFLYITDLVNNFLFIFKGSTETSLGGVLDPVVLGNGSLRLESARAENSGKYKCRADNGVQPALSKTLNIHINGKTDINSTIT